jgi:3-deoxy-7-phosphoheptulonate synthase
VAAGCDGIMVEVHQNPAEALSDGPQSLTPQNFSILAQKLSAFGFRR